MSMIDLNCDMGESFGAYKMGTDEEILNYITSANIACGFHAGDPTTMRKTVTMALERNVGIGVHPGLPDLVGFGRRTMDISPQEAYDLIVYQIGAVYAFTKAEGGKLQHVKPHGALYNMAAKSPSLSEAIAEAIYKVDPELILFGLAGGELVKAGKKIGLRSASEVFSDRTYQEDGSLTSRREENALIHDQEVAVNQVIRIVKEGKVKSLQGVDVSIQAHTVCIHGDGQNALQFAKYISTSLQNAGITIAKISNFLGV
ncbi:LamB/YcsF family protein [Heyndrickxia oleronia]|uniref:5-oxoprolinase subunit A n=1 Tax=Heyndrickxia oleronia TaxID=38875 RepID=A0A8E2LHL1_9BACI|nr:5-oxoprolinase subunit PxpA [Heyndrickxia oleronia]NYV65599.1 LamB/YcsF family protein [Bacillus sp. Gen3]MCI1589103.1 LamB/YcsF family protein [Heyndrickxia oleronia]MCI1611805.1 LamB/YcsF family protein [Heyndrickxia oleronia]MCI1743188.1 LamB/YcsF family protein [Heyndrickxia oleronia]MCI1759683.1 LamB/YcsF family protein [Heyndrickxia oleronia]